MNEKRWQTALKKADLLPVLRGLANNEEGSQFVYDDLPKIKDPPPRWEADLIEATQWDDIDDPVNFLFLCAELLVNLKSNWDGMPGLLGRVLENHKGYLALQLVHRYGVQRKWQLTPGLRRAVLASHDSLGPFRRWLFKVDDPIKELLRHCGSE
ncbi:MAG TPA: hypothetical protein VMI31_10105 [Fimbriimonadaceae bacterium]|nr:hypothetical protein [Fimbriimonadaceae bacterium]